MRQRQSWFIPGAILAVIFVALITTEVTEAQTYSVFYNFTNGADGSYPTGTLIHDSSGNLYGTAFYGGTFGYGTVFKIDPTGAFTTLYSFTKGSDGGIPAAGLFRDPSGNLYGTTSAGGDATCNCGTVFKLDGNGGLTVLHALKGTSNGAVPNSRLVSVDGVLYGTTAKGGKGGKVCGGGCGTIFKVTKGGVYTILHQFTGGADGGSPQGLTRDAAGNLYGATAPSDANANRGTVIKLDTAGKFTVLATFIDAAGTGNFVGRLIRDVNGNIHGAARWSPGGYGEVYRLDPQGNVHHVHIFRFAGASTSGPIAGVLDVAGELYGMTQYGGSLSCPDFGTACGALYRAGNTFSTVHRFAGGTDGAIPTGELTFNIDGSIYGATLRGGTGGFGVIFRYTP